VKTGSLGFSVTLFTVLAIVTIVVLMLRRSLAVFGKAELGGTKVPKVVSAVVVFSFWIIYVSLSALQVQGVIHVDI
jgi:solute carrier family 8 (sodium/calcium exchanger)